MGAGAKNKAGRGPGWLDPRVTYQDYLGDLGDDEDGGDDDHLDYEKSELQTIHLLDSKSVWAVWAPINQISWWPTSSLVIVSTS